MRLFLLLLSWCCYCLIPFISILVCYDKNPSRSSPTSPTCIILKLILFQKRTNSNKIAYEISQLTYLLKHLHTPHIFIRTLSFTFWFTKFPLFVVCLSRAIACKKKRKMGMRNHTKYFHLTSIVNISKMRMMKWIAQQWV